MRVSLLILSLLCLAACTSARLGVDVSSAVYPSDWKCLRSHGYDFAVIRAFQSTGNPDPVAPHTIYNAVDGGYPVSDIDVYIFPDPHRSTPQSQVDSMVSYLKGYNANYTRVWLDIEDTASHAYWGTDYNSNRQWMTDLLIAAVNAVDASHYMWGLVFGDVNWDCCRSYPIWYAAYNNEASMGDWTPFGGWTSPYAHQYQGDANICGVDADLNFKN